MAVTLSTAKDALIKFIAFSLMLFFILIFGFFLSAPMPTIIKLALFFLPALILTFMLDPLLILMCFFLVYPELELFGGMLKYFNALTIVLAFFVVTGSRDKISFCSERLKYYYLFILVAALSIAYSTSRTDSLYTVIKLISFISVYLICYNLLKTKKDGAKLLICFPLATIVPLGYGFYQKLSGQVYKVAASGLERYTSFFAIANSFSRFLLTTFIASVPLYFLVSKRKNYLLGVIAFFSVFSIGLLGVRSIWIMLVFNFFCLGYYIPKMRKYILLLVLFMSVALLGTFVQGFQRIFNPDISRIMRGKTGETIYRRLDWWENALTKVIPQRPILGYGIGTSEGEAQEESQAGKAFGWSPHNDYLRILVETGIAGFIPFLLFVITNLHKLHKNIKSFAENKYFNVCAFALFATFAIMMLAAPVFFNTVYIWYFFGFLAIADKLNYLEKQGLAANV
ncbi:MAG: O-antigen ligase family protein [Candidatus Schekmanbacteria bacterium]|nr:O-antigen ligase family protein [Candidatus Schekmanbacteria bacterium]